MSLFCRATARPVSALASTALRTPTSLTTASSRLAALGSQLGASPTLLLHPSHSTRTMATASAPSTMKGVFIEKTGGTEVLQYKTDIPVPLPKAGEVLVKNDFIGVNFIDTYFRSGLYPAPAYPYTLGREAEGTVISLGGGGSSEDLYNLSPGDRVVWMDTGAYGEYTSVPASKVIKIPSTLPPRVGAAALLQGLTALTLIREAHAVQKGDWVLVHAAAGGTGQWLCKLLRSIGANTIATASTPAKLELAQKAGADHLINYTQEDVKARVMQLTGDKGVIAVFDGVGKSTFDLSLSILARKGSLLSFGNASGPPDPVVVARLGAKNVRLMRPTLFNFIVERDELEHYTNELFSIIDKEKLEPTVHEVYPLSEVKRAHEDLEGRRTTGKLLLDPTK